MWDTATAVATEEGQATVASEYSLHDRMNAVFSMGGFRPFIL